MQSPDYYRNKEQTYLKHFFLERYLQTLAFHIGYGQREFIFVDCFSGPWRSADEEFADSSIRIALDRLNYVRVGLAAQGRFPNIRAVFIEKSAKAFIDLQRVLQQHSGSVKTVAFPGTFQDNIPQILREVGSSFAFFFIDPRGWTGFAMDEIRPILLHEPGEVMVNFMYDFVNRFLNFPSPANEESLDRLFGTTRWREIREIQDRESASIGLYIEQLRETGAFAYVTSTRILKPLHDRAYFHLIYATRSPKGILEFRKVEKKVVTEQESVRQTAQRQDRETRTRQTEIEFASTGEFSSNRQAERASQLQKAEARIHELVGFGPLAYETLQPLILELPLVWNSDLNGMLMEAQRNGRLVIQGLGPRQRAPKQGNLIRLP
jgi:three-Cys-motif partner protein